MNKFQFRNDKAIEFSLGNFLEPGSFGKLFENIKNSLQKEQKDLMFGRKTRQEEKEYFNIMKFLLSSPDKV